MQDEDVPDSEDDMSIAIDHQFDSAAVEHGTDLAEMLDAEHQRALSELVANNRVSKGRISSGAAAKISALYGELESHTRRSRAAIKTVLKRNHALSSRNAELITAAGRRRTELSKVKLAIASAKKESMKTSIQLRSLVALNNELVKVQKDMAHSITDSAKCSICLSIMWIPDTLPKCGHTFCQGCLITWFRTIKQKRSRKYTCPGCRSRIKSQPVRNRAMESVMEGLGNAGIVDGEPVKSVANAYSLFFK
ncbi:hypothetical protein B0H16DRAFT_152139 [Mycena metata]|uniref:RING-type domain-containing protein n=1 Tax=Mycena metata TaxID=1033252 RepID=A0AAD7I3Y8_9AGAR|nr:hypothetical protein B0H16DRAFT_152139 [Mycena metata]